jgi:hypothetical protein
MGLEPNNSPYWDGGAHSNQQHINQIDASQGFDIQYNRPFASPARDVMNGILATVDGIRYANPDYITGFYYINCYLSPTLMNFQPKDSTISFGNNSFKS